MQIGKTYSNRLCSTSSWTSTSVNPNYPTWGTAWYTLNTDPQYHISAGYLRSRLFNRLCK